ncbi:1-aminocyclopropane-1-carboxylate deaminase [Amycolatopsis pretoriensis]|uniref:1-aminocyclopropane-1-carboxylate deaminase n=1 Tax=Amycolatopsis pretoriensis TaxID=218821 RepID=A0A1H5Q355_9PSEU|nr:pyridoxal-phosphate dependent enzyme [Amycolatopsis pretoriensis]SEF20540.1 1-aminocyclopropane-1-carboxylate deaminase [Amycolatopsis pretoriensis]
MTKLQLTVPSPLVELGDAERGVRVLLKRDDLIHPELPGNKWRKLKHNLRDAAAAGATRLLTFGGAYSNHLLATAAAGHHFGFETVGVVRGEEHRPLNDTLRAATAHGMRLTYLDRATYRAKTDPAVVAGLRREWGEFFLIPEGGANAAGVRGCTELVAEIDRPFDVVTCAVGTGATLAGIAAGLGPGQRAIGFSALKGEFLPADVARFQRETFGRELGEWSVETGYHFGGFARRTRELDGFVEEFERRHGVRLDWVYEAKMMFGLRDRVRRGEFAEGTTIVAVIAG